jgi:hypothetical protein
MIPVVVLIAAIQALCGQVVDLNPTGPQFDFLDHMAPAAMVGKHLEGDNTPNYTVKTTDAVWFVKDKSGSPWDKNLYDETGIYAWRTENEWGDPTSYSTWLSMHQVLMAPRVVRGGYPGMRWYSCDSRYSPTTGCGAVAPVHDLGGIIINELWGPYTRTPAFGNLGTFEEITLVYGYGCSPKTPDASASESCSSIETTWWTKEYGGVWWALYGRDRSGAWVMQNHSQAFWVLDGTTTPYFPCDGPRP